MPPEWQFSAHLVIAVVPTDLLFSEFAAMMQVVFIDLVLAGDNAIVVGMAAAGVPACDRRRVICWGILAAVVLRICFATVTTKLLAIIGLTLAGGVLLLWVCWKLYRELREQSAEDDAAELLESGDGDGMVVVAAGGSQVAAAAALPRKSVGQAIVQIALADISMSLDNVLAVAGAAGQHLSALVVGLALSVVLMGVGAALIARVLQRYHWLGYIGLALVGFVAVRMIVEGGFQIAAATGL